MTFKKGDTYRNKFGMVITIIEEPDKLNQVTVRTVIDDFSRTACVNADWLENNMTKLIGWKNNLTKNGYVKEG